MGERLAVVVGAANVDIWGCPAGALVARDSNPGAVRVAPGGVGRNIAHNLRLLGVETELLCALGADLWGRQLRESCREAGIGLAGALQLEDRPSSAYVYITDSAGELALAVCDGGAAEALTPAALEARLPLLNRAAVVIAEGNLSAEALRFLGEAVTAPLFADPVSVPKAKKLLPLLPRLTALKPNAAEAMHMTGEKTPEAAALALWRGGVKNVFVSCGGAGMLVAREGAVVRVPPLPTRLVNATGGGDACTAALAWAYLRGEPPLTAARLALAAGGLTVASPGAICPTLSAEAVLRC